MLGPLAGQLGARSGRGLDARPHRPDGPTLRELARRLRARGVRQLEGPLALTSRTGPAASHYPSVWAADFEGQLYAPPVGPVALHENTISLTYRPGRDTGAPPTLVSAYPDGVDRLVRMAATTVSGSGGRLWLTPAADGGWTLNGTIGVYRRPVGFSAVAHDPSRLLTAVWAAALERAGIRWVMPGGPIDAGDAGAVGPGAGRVGAVRQRGRRRSTAGASTSAPS